MQKYIIKQVKVEGSKATLFFEHTNRNKVARKKTSRTVYKDDKNNLTVLFKGFKFLIINLVDSNSNNEYGLKLLGNYDDRIIGADKGQIEIDINNNGDNNVEVNSEPKQEEPKQIQYNNKVVKHKKYNEIKVCVESDLPVYLYGPAGSGKNHVLQQIADELNLDFYFTNSVQQEYKITGFIDAGGTYHETEFYKAFTNGGLFFLDEMDASIPEVLVLLNSAIANKYFEFPNGKVDAHEDFRVVSAGNTVGGGADEQYTGRLQLDQSTIDRFVMIEFDYDRNIELVLAKGNDELVRFIRSLREQSESKGIQATFSYRSITMVQKLEGKLDLKRIIEIAVIRGLDKDTFRTFNTTPSNKYSKALWVLQQAG